MEDNPINMIDPDGMKVKGIEWQNVTETVQGSRLAEYAQEDLAEANSGQLMNQCCQTARDATRVTTNIPLIQPKFGIPHVNFTPRNPSTIQSYPPKEYVNYQDMGLRTSSLAVGSNVFHTTSAVVGGFEVKAAVTALKGAMAAEGGLNLFKFGSQQAETSLGWKSGDNFLKMFDQGSPKLNWQQNSGLLRQAMSEGKPIFDSYLKADGTLQPTNGFLNAERYLLQDRGWTFSTAKGAWLSPK